MGCAKIRAMQPGLVFYLVLQFVSVSVLPLTFRFFTQLADRGYFLNKALGVLLVSLIFWLGTSFGLLRNEIGGAWLALLLLALVASFGVLSREGSRDLRDWLVSNYSIVLTGELLFLIVFAGWALVRSYDPGIQHTEQPMDLMFLNALWSSPTFPPRDPWLAGYAISYYYFGYWMLNTLGRLASLPPEFVYNLGQACWCGLLLLGSFGIGYNLWARRMHDQGGDASMPRAGAYLCGLLSALLVAVMGNLQILLELAHSAGWDIRKLATWFDVHNFPPSAASITGDPWWWWRSSRVIQDYTWSGQHIEVIDEFPAFSYVLGDNHPHLLAMPFVLLAVGLGLNLFLARERAPWQEGPGTVLLVWRDLLRCIPLGSHGLLLLIGCSGALFFLNSWDYPGGWLLLVLCFLSALRFGGGVADPPLRALWTTLLFGILLAVGALVLYFPFLLTGQSQVTGLVANLLHPTYFPQFVLMFGAFLPGLGSLIILAWREQHPSIRHLWGSVLLILGYTPAFSRDQPDAIGERRRRAESTSAALGLGYWRFGCGSPLDQAVSDFRGSGASPGSGDRTFMGEMGADFQGSRCVRIQIETERSGPGFCPRTIGGGTAAVVRTRMGLSWRQLQHAHEYRFQVLLSGLGAAWGQFRLRLASLNSIQLPSHVLGSPGPAPDGGWNALYSDRCVYQDFWFRILVHDKRARTFVLEGS